MYVDEARDGLSSSVRVTRSSSNPCATACSRMPRIGHPNGNVSMVETEAREMVEDTSISERFGVMRAQKVAGCCLP